MYKSKKKVYILFNSQWGKVGLKSTLKGLELTLCNERYYCAIFKYS